MHWVNACNARISGCEVRTVNQFRFAGFNSSNQPWSESTPVTSQNPPVHVSTYPAPDCSVGASSTAKAFDKVLHKRLAIKLEHYDIRGKSPTWIQSFLQNRTQLVVIHGHHYDSSSHLTDVNRLWCPTRNCSRSHIISYLCKWYWYKHPKLSTPFTDDFWYSYHWQT